MSKKKSSLCVLSLASLFAMTIGLASCNDEEKQEVKYTVKFDTDGGSNVPDMTYTGTALNLPTPTKTVDGVSYFFEGWYLNEDLTGQEVSSPYTPESDVTLYADWTEGSKISVYYGSAGNYEDIIVRKGEEFSVEDLADYDDDVTIKGAECPFVKWVFATLDTNGNLVLGEDFTNSFVANDSIYYISAVYDETNVPKEQHLEDEGNGYYRVTGNVNWNLYEGEITDARGIYECDISFAEGSNISSGAVGIAWRGTFNNADRSWETNSDYMSVQLGLDKNTIQVASVTFEDGFDQMKGSKPTVLPESYTEKVAALKSGKEQGSLHLKVVDNGDSFKAYVDDALVYDYNYGEPADSSSPNGRTYDSAHFTGTGFGVRASKGASGAIIGNFKYTPMTKVTLDANGGTFEDGTSTKEIGYIYGKLPVPTSQNGVFAGWYKDKELKEPYDVNEIATEPITLYASWTKEVTLNFYIGNEELTGTPVSLAHSQKVNLDEVNSLDSSTLPIPEPLEVQGIAYPFDHWELNGEEVSGVININTQLVYDFFAVYDTTGGILVRFSSDDKVYETVVLTEEDSKTINLDNYKPSDEVANGREFLHWTINGDKVTGEFTITDTFTTFEAVYRQDWTKGILNNADLGGLIPGQKGVFGFDESITELVTGLDSAMTGDFSKLQFIKEPAKINMLGNTAYPYIFKGYDDVTDVRGVYEADIEISGKAEGAAGIAWRGHFDIENTEAASYQTGCNYVTVQIGLNKGKLQVGRILNGGWSELQGSKPNDSTYPPIFNKQLTDYRTNGVGFTAHFKVIDYGDYFVLYVGDELVFESNNPDPTSTVKEVYNANDYKDTGFGWRSSATSNVSMSGFQYHTLEEAEELGLIPTKPAE